MITQKLIYDQLQKEMNRRKKKMYHMTGVEIHRLINEKRKSKTLYMHFTILYGSRHASPSNATIFVQIAYNCDFTYITHT